MNTTTDGAGVSNADYILYVSARDSECSTSSGGPVTLAFAGACQMESNMDRPIAGSINFCPAWFTDTSNEFIFSVTKHEMLHALAFSRSLFPFWRDSEGNPRTPRGSNGLPPIDNGSAYPLKPANLHKHSEHLFPLYSFLASLCGVVQLSAL